MVSAGTYGEELQGLSLKIATNMGKVHKHAIAVVDFIYEKVVQALFYIKIKKFFRPFIYPCRYAHINYLVAVP